MSEVPPRQARGRISARPLVEVRQGVVEGRRRQVKAWIRDRIWASTAGAVILAALAAGVPHGGLSIVTAEVVVILIWLFAISMVAVRGWMAWRKTGYVLAASRGPTSEHASRDQLLPSDAPSGTALLGSLQVGDIAYDVRSPDPAMPNLPHPEPISDDLNPRTYEVHPEALRGLHPREPDAQ